MDKVTELQDYVDQLALSMFNGLRLLPAKKTANPEDGDSVENGKSADDLEKERVEQIKSLAKAVLEASQAVNKYIDQLPGANKTELEQLEELAMLEQENQEQERKLKEVLTEADAWMEHSRTALRTIADDHISSRSRQSYL